MTISGDPALVGAAATGGAARREGRRGRALRRAAARRDRGRAQRCSSRGLWVPDEFGLTRYLAAGLAVLHVVDPGLRTDLAALADELDAEALRNSAARELFTNPAKTLADRMSGRTVVLAGDNAATLALARHAGAIHAADRAPGGRHRRPRRCDRRVAHRVSARIPTPTARPRCFHDDEIDGPLPERARTIALTLDAERAVVTARVAGLDDVDIVGAEDVPDVGDVTGTVGASRAAIGDAGRSVGDGGHLPATGSRIGE